ncbi:O-antigen ligase family protein [Opitutus sp. ER46]|uniref:O-antigen ligase family protein n=1 Tax=Opitutus sp. ER46 TaxID=2161864 RepID=UPI000D304226|nr:O-antigen ligase family protein [Opitutus sp. ER46]PTX90844.1 hypothetical protein DB354_19520 [Opitutus sp. ER46]
MEIETKQIFALILIVGFGSIAMLAALLWQWVRDAVLFTFVVGVVFIDRLDVSLFGTFWYRGTSRGIDLSLLDVAPLSLLIATLLAPRYARGRFHWPASFGLMLLYFLYCVASVYHAHPQWYGVWELAKMTRGLMVFLAAALFIRTRRELAVVLIALGCTACVEAFNGVEQRWFKGAFRAPGTLLHPNTLSTYLCTIAPVLIAGAMANWSKWIRGFAALSWALAAVAELLTLSRMGIPVFGAVSVATALACTSWRITKEKLAVVAAAGAVVAAGLFVSWDGLKARYVQGDIKQELTGEHQIETRGVYWRLALAMIEDHPYGVGLNNWSYFVGKTYGPAMGYAYHDYDEFKWVPTKDDAAQTFLPPAADSLPALTLGELGKAGLALFLLLWLRWFQIGAGFLRGRLNGDPLHRAGLGLLFGTAGLFLQSATEWTYRQTPVLFTFHVMMGALASLHAIRRRRVAVARRTRQAAPEPDLAGVPVRTVPVVE